jgi:hypothetical protein
MYTTHSSQHGFVAMTAYFEKCNIFSGYFINYTCGAGIKSLVPSVASKDRNLSKGYIRTAEIGHCYKVTFGKLSVTLHITSW